MIFMLFSSRKIFFTEKEIPNFVITDYYIIIIIEVTMFLFYDVNL